MEGDHLFGRRRIRQAVPLPNSHHPSFLGLFRGELGELQVPEAFYGSTPGR